MNRRAFVSGAVALAACKSAGPVLRPAKDRPGVELLSTPDGDVPIDAGDPQRGPRESQSVLVVFSDFECPFCADASAAIRTVASEQPRLRVVFKHMPLPRHEKARAMALASQAVFLSKGEDAFWRIHDAMFALHGAPPADEQIAKWVADAGLGSSDVEAVADASARRVLEDVELAKAMKIDGTPQLYFDRHAFGGAPTVDQLRRLVGLSRTTAPSA